MKYKLSVVIPAWNQENLIIRAIESIPCRNDIEIIVIDDGSTDDTWQRIQEYRESHVFRNLILLYNKDNMGVAYTVNRGYDTASGEYVVLLGSDDYFIPPEFENALKYLDGTDLVYFNLRVNSGKILKVTADNKYHYCGSTKFMRREFIGDTRCPENMRVKEDAAFYQELMKKPHTEFFTNITLKHYNFPRKGSLMYNNANGVKE